MADDIPEEVKDTSEDDKIASQLHSLDITTLVIINGKKVYKKYNTWTDWHLVPTSRPVIKIPEIKKYSQDIPGGNGELDFTTSLTGYPVYKNRTGSFEFMVMNRSIDTNLGDAYGYNNETNTEWRAIYSEISNTLHGKIVYLQSPEWKGWYFKGRLTVNDWKSDSAYSSIVLDYDLEPFMLTVTDSSNLWEWDTFNFRTGIIKTYNEDKLQYDQNGKTFHIDGTLVPVSPTIYVSTDTELTTQAGTYSLSAGSNKSPFIQVYPGAQEWTFKATTNTSAKAAIYFRERSF